MSKDDASALDELITRVLLDVADDSKRQTLAGQLAESHEAREHFLDHVAVHGFLADEAKAGSFAEDQGQFFNKLEAMETPVLKPSLPWRFRVSATAAAAALVIGLLAISIPLWPTKAIGELDHVIEAFDRRLDRTYLIKSLDDHPPKEVAPQSERGRFPVGVFLDGARLHLRGRDQFVLEQELPNGETRIMASNGESSWSMRGKGPVHVSDDPARFGGWIFAKSGQFAFLDLRSQLEDLRKFYQLEPLERTSPEIWKIRGSRHSKNQGGPREIELWFNPDDGTLDRMILRELPRDNGGPRSIAISLRSTDPLPPDFFQHSSHHDSSRPILKEP